MKSSKFFLGLTLFAVIFACGVLASHVVTTSSGATSFTAVSEDSSNFFNITVNNTDTTFAANISKVNISLISATDCSFVATTNGTDSSGVFANGSNYLMWNASALIMNSTAKSFWFNLSCATPGNYNLTIITTNITASYSSNLSFTVNDLTNPVAAINSPTSTNYSGAITLNATVTDVGGLNSSAIYFNLTNSSGEAVNGYSTISATKNGSTNDWIASLNTALLSDGNYNVILYAYDNAGNLNNTAAVSFTVDNTLPVVSFVSSTADNASSVLRRWVFANVSLTETNFKNITFRIGNTSWLNTTSYLGDSAANRTVNWSIPNYGTYYYNATVCDKAGNCNVTENRQIVLAGTSTTLNSPADVSFTNQSTIIFNCTSQSDSSYILSNVTFYLWNSTGSIATSSVQNISGVTNTTTFSVNFSALTEDAYSWNCLTVNNHSSNSLAANRSLTYDVSAPVISLVSPLDNAVTSSADVVFVYNVSDVNSVNCSLLINDIVSDSNDSANHTGGSSSFSKSFSSGVRTWGIQCVDLAGNVGTNSSYTLNVSLYVAPIGGSRLTAGAASYVSDSELAAGYTKNLSLNQGISLMVKGNLHSLMVNNVSRYAATITIASTPQTKVLRVGEAWDVDINGDGVIDLRVSLNSIQNGVAGITVKTISVSNTTSEAEKTVTVPQTPTNEQVSDNTLPKINNSSFPWKYLFVGVTIFIIIIAFVIFGLIVRNKKHKHH